MRQQTASLTEDISARPPALSPSSPANPSRPHALWMVLLVALTLLFFLDFFNRFLGLRSGNGEFVTGMWFLRGKLPYRDYFSATPPLNTLKSALLLHLFGPFLIVSRAAGVLERVVIAFLLFRWLSRLFAAPYAFAATLVTIILSAGDMVDPVASYNHDALLWAIASGYMASLMLDEPGRTRSLLWSALAGLFAGLCFLTKQTVGLGAIVAVPVVVALLLANAGSWRAASRWCAGFPVGAAVPVAILALWLHAHRILLTFLTMAFLKGPAAKSAHPADFLVREAMVARDNWILILVAIVGIACFARALYRSQQTPSPQPQALQPDTRNHLRNLGLGFGLTILCAELLGMATLETLHNQSKVAVYFAFIQTAVLLTIYAVASTRTKLTPRQRQFALFAAVSFFIAFFLSLSWPAFEAMLLPGLAFLIAAVLDGVRHPTRRVVYVLLAVLVFFQVREKLDLPFGFDGLDDNPVREATAVSKLPELRGMRLPPETIRFVEDTVATIHAHAAPADTIFTYPEMALFYELSDRTYPTLAASHNVDVVNDSFAVQEAARILEQRPAVVIAYKLTPDEVAREDSIWRFGKPSGQHTLVRAIDQLTAAYPSRRSYLVGQDARPVVVYVHP